MRIQLSLLLVAAFSQVGATDCGQVIRDPGFDLWCGSALCTWKVERGEIKQVPTWHDGDSGVELLGTDSAIEQTAPVNSGDGSCLKFDLVADVEDNAEVYLNVDVEGDGTLEMHERFPTAHWKPLSYTFAINVPYDGIRFELTKKGNGRAVLAQIGAETRPAAECEGLTSLDPGPRKNGARCVHGTDCSSGLCVGSPTPIPGGSWIPLVCAGCDPSAGAAACTGAGETCGLGDAPAQTIAVPMQCEPKGNRELGERCRTDDECTTTICLRTSGASTGMCSSCLADTTCPATQLCAASWADGPAHVGPFVCGGGQHLALAGAACGSDDDCASSKCAGTPRKECNDGRVCDSPANCPITDGLAPGPCTAVGIQGGTCD